MMNSPVVNARPAAMQMKHIEVRAVLRLLLKASYFVKWTCIYELRSPHEYLYFPNNISSDASYAPTLNTERNLESPLWRKEPRVRMMMRRIIERSAYHILQGTSKESFTAYVCPKTVRRKE